MYGREDPRVNNVPDLNVQDMTLVVPSAPSRPSRCLCFFNSQLHTCRGWSGSIRLAATSAEYLPMRIRVNQPETQTQSESPRRIWFSGHGPFSRCSRDRCCALRYTVNEDPSKARVFLTALPSRSRAFIGLDHP